MANSQSTPAIWVGTWRNEKGSLLRITAVSATSTPGGGLDHYRVEGSFASRVGNADFGEQFPLTGYAIGNLIAFTVSFHRLDPDTREERASVCAWAGQYLPAQRPDGSYSPQDSAERLKTLWHLVPDTGAPGHERDFGWLLAHAGEDEFSRLSSDPGHRP